MQPSEHLHDRIAKATNRLAQLQAQELVTAQRKALRARAVARRNDTRRRKRLAELLYATGSEALEDGEIVAAMLRYQAECRDDRARSESKQLVETYLSNLATGSVPSPALSHPYGRSFSTGFAGASGSRLLNRFASKAANCSGSAAKSIAFLPSQSRASGSAS